MYIVSNSEGKMIDVITAESWNDAWERTIGMNHGEFLVEITEDDKKIIERLLNETNVS